MSFGRVVSAHKIGGHVVGGTERTCEAKTSTRRERRNFFERYKGRPENDGVAMIIDATSTCSAGELRVLRWSKELVSLAGELCEFVDDDSSRRHVDSQRQGFRREDDSHQTFHKALLDRFFEWRHETGMVTRNSTFKGIKPSSVIENPEILVGKVFDVRFGDESNSISLFFGGVGQSGSRA